MTLYYSATAILKSGDTYVRRGCLTSDAVMFEKVVGLATRVVADNKCKTRWRIYFDNRGDVLKCSCADDDALKQMIKKQEHGDAEETATGCWSIPGCNFNAYVYGERVLTVV